MKHKFTKESFKFKINENNSEKNLYLLLTLTKH